MIKTIASAVKQAVFSKSFLVSWIGVVAIIAVSSIQQILEAFRADELLMIGFHDTFIANALVSGQMVDETRLFDRTYRGEEARSNQGTGLGLYIVKLLAMKQGAEVFARKEESSLRIGIRFKKEI